MEDSTKSMKVLFDTSVLVPALVERLPFHAKAVTHLNKATRGETRLFISAHALAETYSSLTTLPVQPRITPAEALQIVQESVRPHAEVVPLDAADYEAVLARMADLGLVSGAVYDGLHVRAAEKAGAGELLTCNGRDFRRMPPAPPTRLVVV